ncbi:unnamed protein product [Boreogadus saida]
MFNTVGCLTPLTLASPHSVLSHPSNPGLTSQCAVSPLTPLTLGSQGETAPSNPELIQVSPSPTEQQVREHTSLASVVLPSLISAGAAVLSIQPEHAMHTEQVQQVAGQKVISTITVCWL